jgi:ATP-dependent DNA ligase
MALPIKPPFLPMEALSVDRAPRGPQWQYEPKWDGFRCLLFREGAQVTLQSKSGRPLTRYFPEIVEGTLAVQPNSFVLDGEIVVPQGNGFSFDHLLQRIHPANRRIQRLAQETPALFIAFDLLVDAGRTSLVPMELTARRSALEKFAGAYFPKQGLFRLSPATTRLSVAGAWLKRVGSTLDGIIAKRRDQPYRSGERAGMQKIKNYRSADCVVGGFRYNEGKTIIGSLLLGLYDADGLLHHVGYTSALKAAEKPALTERLEKMISPPGFTGNKPGGPSRWSRQRSAQWQPLKATLVVEVRYDHFEGGRFRHGTTLLRWRPDKAPGQCTVDQVRQKRTSLMHLLG